MKFRWKHNILNTLFGQHFSNVKFAATLKDLLTQSNPVGKIVDRSRLDLI